LVKFINENKYNIEIYKKLYRIVLDNDNEECLKILIENDKSKGKIISNLYNNIIIQSKKDNFKISKILKYLIGGKKNSINKRNKYIENNKLYLLKIIIDYYIYYLDNKSILKLILCHKNNESLSYKQLKEIILYKNNIEFDINAKLYDNEETLLNKACDLGNVFFVKYFIEHGADPNNNVSEKRTPLIIACKKGNEDLIKCLHECGDADINDRNNYKYSPLYIGCMKGNVSIVRYLVEHGANVNSICSECYRYMVDMALNMIIIIIIL